MFPRGQVIRAHPHSASDTQARRNNQNGTTNQTNSEEMSNVQHEASTEEQGQNQDGTRPFAQNHDCAKGTSGSTRRFSILAPKDVEIAIQGGFLQQTVIPVYSGTPLIDSCRKRQVAQQPLLNVEEPTKLSPNSAPAANNYSDHNLYSSPAPSFDSPECEIAKAVAVTQRSRSSDMVGKNIIRA